MTELILILAPPVFVAAALQAATGLGFGMIAGPFLLVALNGIGAVQATILLSLLIAVIALPPVIGHTDRRALAMLGAGTLIGLPVGGFLLAVASMATLKLMAVFVVSAAVFMMLRHQNNAPGDTVAPGSLASNTPFASGSELMLGAGAASGAMSAALGMPGPAPAGVLAARGASKETLRATILSLFAGSYSGAVIAHGAAFGIAAPTLQLAAALAVPAIGGAVAGHFLARRFSARLFRHILIVLLFIAAAGLLISAVRDLL